MEHLYIRKPFIDYKLYATSSGLVDTDFKSILYTLTIMHPNEETIDILCDKLPIDEIQQINNAALICPVTTNASFMYRPIPVDMITPNCIVICYGSSTEQKTFVHQVAFIFNSHMIRMGISW